MLLNDAMRISLEFILNADCIFRRYELLEPVAGFPGADFDIQILFNLSL